LTASKGIVASGHTGTSAAAVEVLEAGGNAFDAALAGLCAACVCEPMLASLGGGGFLMAQPANSDARVFDFFAHTPGVRKPAGAIDFYPILADFGTAQQEFHIGLGAMAVPGVVAGLFAIHGQLCRLDMLRIVAPAMRLAREGVEVTPLQEYISHVLEAILQTSPDAMALVAAEGQAGRIAAAGSLVRHPELADTLEALATEGPDLFYRGELARRLVADCEQRGGQVSLADLAAYRVITRPAIEAWHGGAHFAFNSPPSPSGCLLAFALGMLETVDFGTLRWGSPEHCMAMAGAIRAAGEIRSRRHLDEPLDEVRARAMLDPELLRHWREMAMPGELFSRGTTHVSVVDAEGNLASLTFSNGEGCAYVLPGTGIMMNNMLGEEDLHPRGFQTWPEDRRLASMMCPTVVTLADGGRLALGSGGSNRIRSAILQVLVNRLGFGMDLEAAVNAPRLHLEGDYLSLEAGFPAESVAALTARWPEHQAWPEPNLFFGGVHTVERLQDGRLLGAGDPRRGGCVATAGAVRRHA